MEMWWYGIVILKLLAGIMPLKKFVRVNHLAYFHLIRSVAENI